MTVVLNAAGPFERTADSVLAEDYPGLEYIVVDGGSHDGTVECIRAREGRLARWLSEPDRGLYDAMNKAVAMATGTWIYFLNAGDELANGRGLAAALADAEDLDIVLAPLLVIDDWSGATSLRQPPDPAVLGYMSLPQQATLMRTELLRRRPFDLEVGLSADYDALLAAWRRGARMGRSHVPLARYPRGGLSERRCVSARLSQWRSVRKHRPGVTMDLYYAARLVEACVLWWIQRYAPRRVAVLFLRVKDRIARHLRGRRPSARRT